MLSVGLTVDAKIRFFGRVRPALPGLTKEKIGYPSTAPVSTSLKPCSASAEFAVSTNERWLASSGRASGLARASINLRNRLFFHCCS